MAYKNDRLLLNFLYVDYNGSNPISKYALHNYVLGYTWALQEEADEPVAMYGVNVKHSKVSQKHDEIPARDLAVYFAQADLFGENHKRKHSRGSLKQRLLTPGRAGIHR